MEILPECFHTRGWGCAETAGADVVFLIGVLPVPGMRVVFLDEIINLVEESAIGFTGDEAVFIVFFPGLEDDALWGLTCIEGHAGMS